MILVPVLLIQARATSQFLKVFRGIVLVMISFQQDDLLHILLLQRDDLHQVQIDVISQTILILVRVKIVTKKHHPVNSIYILPDRFLPKEAPMHIGNDKYSFHWHLST